MYEMAAYFLIFFYLYKHRHKVNFKGELFFEYLFLTGLARFLIEFLREHPVGNHGHSFEFAGLFGAQYVYMFMIIGPQLTSWGFFWVTFQYNIRKN